MNTTNRVPLVPAARLTGKTIVLGVTGSIAAYKAASLARRLMTEGATVRVVMTHTAQRFVAPLTFEALTGHPVFTDLFESETGEVGVGGASAGPPPTKNVMPHLALADGADLIVIAPASAHCVAKLAHGLADDLLTTLVLAAECPVVVVPAMDGGMWTHPAVRANVRTLRQRGVTVLEPEVGPLASGRVGKGRFPEEDPILAAICGALCTKDFRGRRILITAGPTQEPLDPVRFLSNRSSGKMGWALSEAARDRGADVVLVAGPTSLAPVPNVTYVPVVTSEEMRKEVVTRFPGTDVLIMAAAVADFQPARQARGKVPKGRDVRMLALEPTKDILKELASRRAGQVVVGFAAETGDLVARARGKLLDKALDLIVANDVTEPGAGFGTDTNRATLLDRAGRCDALPLMSKHELAHRILDAVLTLP
ncbi:MAG TPA: bifunctional phosphopantothenoylcysteine decarboxylase/phosphopantothenate--cysteine ligase CoaBC [Nitrospirales bacterium]|nr:bifunctional phosphopantothenoylcysteine decarboxylase/phosphopantothenate--cysteine ligase CoaBC [Nitrospirales bacterium]